MPAFQSEMVNPKLVTFSDMTCTNNISTDKCGISESYHSNSICVEHFVQKLRYKALNKRTKNVKKQKECSLYW